ncbi:MAG: ABC transporter ATP-binding protein [Lachnospiraceae bacterium]|nr:ABC transporter ATP-binding protein [Lachnospiraceae bacterium]
MSEKVLEIKNLTYLYPKSENGVKDISLYVNVGSIVGLLGESGCGKSTLAKCISKQLPIRSGEISCGKIGYIFQDNYASLNPSKKVGWLLREAIRYNNPTKRNNAEELILDILKEVELDPAVLEHYPNELSGGQRQRIGIAMALLTEPDILIADEPVSALDVTVQKQVIKLIKKLNKDKKLAILFISHDIKVVKEICNYIYIIKDGILVEEGDSDKIFNDPETDYTRDLLDSSYLIGDAGNS